MKREVKLKISKLYNTNIVAFYDEEVVYEIYFCDNEFLFREYDGISLTRTNSLEITDYTELDEDLLFQYSLVYELEHVIPFCDMIELQRKMKYINTGGILCSEFIFTIESGKYYCEI